MALPTEKSSPVIRPERLRVMIFGPPKVGKSTFAVQNPKALIIDSDNNGTEFLSCYRVSVYNWSDLRAVLKDLKEAYDAGTLQFDTIVFDTVDMLYHFCRQDVCKENGVSHESEDKSFGRIWDLVKTQWMKMVSFVNSLGVGLWMISHSVQKEAKIDGVKRTIVTSSLPTVAQRLVNAMADQIVYMDCDDEGKRTLYNVPQPGIECGGRLCRKNIKFGTEEEAYGLFLKAITQKE